jgi:hypothetical protein
MYTKAAVVSLHPAALFYILFCFWRVGALRAHTILHNLSAENLFQTTVSIYIFEKNI